MILRFLKRLCNGVMRQSNSPQDPADTYRARISGIARLWYFAGTAQAVFLAMALTACSGPREAMDGLDAILLATPDDEEAPRQGTFKSFAETVAGEKVDDPVEFCLDHIQELEGKYFNKPLERIEPVFILSKVAAKSPSQVVRARSLQALESHFIDPVILLQRARAEPELAVLEEHFSRLNQILNEGKIKDRRTDIWQDAYVLEIKYFASLGAGHSDAVWQTLLTALSKPYADSVKDKLLYQELELAAWLLVSQRAFIAVHEAMVDPAAIVRQVGIDFFFRFSWEAIIPSLSFFLEQNAYLKSPIHKIAVLKRIREKEDRPDLFPLKIMRYIIESLNYQAHAGVVYHGIKTLQSVTGQEWEDPASWMKWWDEYLLEHADESG